MRSDERAQSSTGDLGHCGENAGGRGNHHSRTGWIVRCFRGLAGRTGPGLLLSLALLPALGLVGLGTAPTEAASVWGPGPIGPYADWLDDLENEAGELKRLLDEAAAAIAGGHGPLTGKRLTVVAKKLERAERIADTILDPQQYPSLDPPDAGEVDPAVDPSTLWEHSMDTCLLALAAHLEIQGNPDFDADFVGTQIRTIVALIPGYRTAAGIR